MTDVTDGEEDHDELVYELPEWSDEQRGELALVLDRENIPYQWEGGTDLIVAAADEDRVDALLDEIERNHHGNYDSGTAAFGRAVRTM